MVRRYSLGGHQLIDKIVNEFNQTEIEGYSIQEISGIVMDQNNNFTSVMEYYEISEKYNFDLKNHLLELQASIMISKKLNIPMFIIVYRENSEFFEIHDYFNNVKFNKKYTELDNSKNDFLIWWKQYKGTVQSKPLYRADYTSCKINQVFNTGMTKWGGDIDGVIIYNDNEIISLIEFRKSTKELVSNYDPNKYYRGTQYRAGDYMTWYPLIHLKNILSIPLYLITLSENDVNKYGYAEILSQDRQTLHYKNGIVPGKNATNDLKTIFKQIKIK